MALRKIRIGSFVEQVKIKCNIPNLTPDDVSGINRDKEFFEPSKQVGGDTSDYKIVPPGCFACNLMHVGRDVVLPIALNETNKNKIVSPAYTVFRFKNEDEILKKYFFMYLKSSEKDRFFWFHTDCSVRDGMDWEIFENLSILVPNLDIQKKYVNAYESILLNCRAYKNKLSDLKLTCDIFIENLRKNYPLEKVGNFIELYKEINSNLKVKKLAGLIGGEIESARKASGQQNLEKFQIIYPRSIVYPPPHFGEIGTIGIVKDEPVLMSPMYVAFKSKNEQIVNLEYLLLWFRRNEFKRYAFFCSCSSVRDTFDFDLLKEYSLPVPPIRIQKSIVTVFNMLNLRSKIYQQIYVAQSKICPILINASLKEGENKNA